MSGKQRTADETTQADFFRNRLTSAYQVCVLGLAIGIMLSGLACTISIWPISKPTSLAAALLVTNSSEPVVMRSNARNFELLVKTPTGTAWKAIALPSTP